MKDNVLRDYLIESGFLSCDIDGRKTIFSNDIAKQEEKLKALLDETQLKEVWQYEHFLTSHLFNIRDIECFKMFYLRIMLGMDISDFRHEEVDK